MEVKKEKRSDGTIIYRKPGMIKEQVYTVTPEILAANGGEEGMDKIMGFDSDAVVYYHPDQYHKMYAGNRPENHIES